MLSVSVFNYRFTLNWKMAILSLLAMAVFISLGIWQCLRAAEKKQMLSSHASLLQQAPQAWLPGMKKPQQYQNISVQGRYLPIALLLDNQHYQHQFGYDLLAPFLLKDNRLLFVDRGWIPASATIPAPAQVQKIQGSVYYPSKKAWILGQDFEKKAENLFIIERLDTRLLSQLLHKSVYPFIMRLGKEEAGGFVREWPIVAMPPERHYAYALQWFAMALVIFIIFIGLHMKKVERS